MGSRDQLILGLWNVICDRCGFKYKSNELKKEWTNLMVCNSCWEPRHPQDFVRSIPDQLPLPYTRPEAPDTYVIVNYIASSNQCSVFGGYCQASFMEADCAVVGTINGDLII